MRILGWLRRRVNHEVNAYDKMRNDGVHTLWLDDLAIKVKTVGLGNAARNSCALVCFSGAVTNRLGKKGPFFSGAKMQDKLGLPLISIADPVLDMCDTLRLSWYAGTRDTPQLPKAIAFHLDAVAARLGLRLLMFGGSGGGFAILNVQQHMKCAATSLVWNPQTNIARYALPQASEYASVALGRPVQFDSHAEVARVLGSAGLHYDVTSATMQSGELVYLQNSSDSHVKRHMKPLLAQGDWTAEGLHTWNSDTRRIRVALADWGKGHASMPKETLIAALHQLAAGMPVPEVARQIQHRHAI